VKKYPFSTKAMKAFLAATVAFTPVVSTGVMLNTTKVEAATTDFNSTDTLIAYLDRIYDQLSTSERAALDSTRDKLVAIPKSQWDAYALRVADNPTVLPEEKKELLGGLMILLTSTNVLDLDGKIDTFRTNQAANVDKVFGQDVTVNMMLKFVADVEIKFLNNIRDLDISTMSNNQFYVKFLDAVVAVQGTDSTTDNYKVADKFLKVVNVTEAIKVLQDLSAQTDSTGAARSAVINALKKVQPVTIPGPGPGPTPQPQPGPQPPDEGAVTLPPGATNETKGTNSSGQIEVTTSVPIAKVQEIVNLITAEKNVVELILATPAPGEVVKAEVPASLFTAAAGKNADAAVAVTTADASYKLPVSEVNVTALATKLGVPASELKINIYVNEIKVADAKAVGQNGLKLASKIIDFTVEVVGGGKKETLATFSTFVEREISRAENFNAINSVAVKLNDDGTFSSIPTLFNGGTATIKSLTNSKYTIVENNKTFTDVNGKSWAENYIEALASKYIINGKTKDKYDPAGHMTRAEFAVLLVRALGLPTTGKYEGGFKDVNGAEWFAKKGELSAAVKYSVVRGMGNGKFAPNDKITRAEAAVMIDRAMNLKFINFDKAQLIQVKKLSDFKDAKQVGTWAKAGVERVYQAGIVDGTKEGNYNPNGYTQRDQMAKILANFLVKAKLMNKIN
jgi:hypothetical protein